MIIYDVYYDYFLLELFSLMPTMIIFDMIYDDICRFLCLCDVYFYLLLL